jgi:hypothetical protein
MKPTCDLSYSKINLQKKKKRWVKKGVDVKPNRICQNF